MNRNDRPEYRRWALILLGTAVLALGGCGRKGPLDLPPTASGSGQQPTAAVQSDSTALAQPGYNSDQPPTAGKGPKRPFALDPLLNSN